MIGVVACESLYNEIERLRPDVPVQYVPQELHEFPVNVPQEVDVQERLQDAIDALDAESDSELDRIVVLYANSSADTSELRPTHVPLVVARIQDCISALLDQPVSETSGESKDAATYYLTRGSIDCGVDGYKLHEAYRGELDALLDRFEAARDSHPDLRITWPDGERFSSVADRGHGLASELVGDTFHEILGDFDRVELIDTGDLYDVHREYAESFRSFIERLSRTHGDGHDVTLAVADGTTGTINQALSNEPLETLARNGQFTISPPIDSKD